MAQVEQDRSERTVAKIFLGDESVNAQLLPTGMDWHHERYSGNCPSALRLSRQSRRRDRKTSACLLRGTCRRGSGGGDSAIAWSPSPRGSRYCWWQ
ncbi:thermonuclease family protein [Rubidibacter lacunae]|uniref:thermonuclease family protein n=1 Tax=Rubidibacter lacunae TaxID=582514 RepID=UPI0038CDC815